MGFGGLDSSLRFEPQITKLRSWKKDSSNFEHDYEFGHSHLIWIKIYLFIYMKIDNKNNIRLKWRIEYK